LRKSENYRIDGFSEAVINYIFAEEGQSFDSADEDLN